MTKAALASTYEIFSIKKEGRPEVDITGQDSTGPQTVLFNYYESIFSPSVTATIALVETGSSIPYDRKYDSQERLGTLSSALPLSGDVSVSFKIKTKYGDLNFTKKPLLFDKVINPGDESNRESIIMNLVSDTFRKNEESSVNKKYTGNISDTVKNITSNYLKVDNINIDKTQNSNSFIGNNRPPFEVICELAKKSIPGKGNPGYFFYETKDGLNYRSIDDLIRQSPVAKYDSRDVLESNLDNDENDFKILYKSDIKKGDLMNLLRSGSIFSKNIFWDPLTFEYEEISENLEGKIVTSLGKDAILPTVKNNTRTHFHIKDIGTLSRKIREENPNNDPKFWQSTSTMRYNLLFSQIIQIQVPCNIKLKAGDTILCDFDPVTADKKVQGTDPVMSGKYLIANLCHHFDPLRSITSMTLVRDSYGLYTNKNK
jgi:hypothetical protein